MTQEVDQSLELLRVLGADVGRLAQQVLGALDTTHAAVHAGIAEATVDDDGATDGLAGWLQQLATAVDQAGNLQDVGDVVGILVEVAELAHGEVGRETDVIDDCVHNHGFLMMFIVPYMLLFPTRSLLRLQPR